MANSLCSTCKNGIFCETWGEFKCSSYKVRFREEVTECALYEKRKGDATPCHCDACENRLEEME